MELEPKDYLGLFILLSVIFSAIYIVYTIPTEIKLGAIPYPDYENKYDWVYEKSWDDISLRIWTANIAYLIIAIISGILLWFSYRTIKLLEAAKKRTIEYFALSMLFYMLGAIAMVIGTSAVLLFKTSFNKDVWYGAIYPCSLPVAMMFTGIAPYFMLKFSHWVSERREPGKIKEIPVLTLLVLLLVLMISPYNWFGVYRPGLEVLDIRMYSNGLLLLVNLVAIFQILIFLYRRIRRESHPIRIARLKTVMYGFIALLGFFACYTLDALTHQPYTIWMFVAYPFAWIAIILIYLGTVTPEWYLSWLQKKYASGA